MLEHFSEIFIDFQYSFGLPWWLSWWRIHLQCRRPGFDPWVGKTPWRRERLPTPVFWPGEFHGLDSPWGHKESDTTEWLHFHFSLSRIGEGNGNPPQCSCLENPRSGVAWWADVCGVATCQTRLKWLSSSSSSSRILINSSNFPSERHPSTESAQSFFSASRPLSCV